MKLLYYISYIKRLFGEHIICKLIRILNRELMFRVDCYDDGFYPCHYYLIIININNLLIYINSSFVYVHNTNY